MPVDVSVTTTIQRPCADVAQYAANPDNAPEWYANIHAATWRTTPNVEVGARINFEAKFLGRTLAYTYEIVEYLPGERLTMQTANGPFPMRTTYTWEAVGPHATRMTLRNSGAPSGFAKLSAPLMEAAMRRANTQDLRRIKQILESAPTPA